MKEVEKFFYQLDFWTQTKPGKAPQLPKKMTIAKSALSKELRTILDMKPDDRSTTFLGVFIEVVPDVVFVEGFDAKV